MEGFIDIHTHRESTIASLSIINRHTGFAAVHDGVPCSAGIHPWYIEHEKLNAQLEELAEYAGTSNVLAIGECGLDKLTDTDWDMQVRAFEAQVQLANKLKKPLIIHCVKAYEEVLAVLRQQQVTVPVIFHGFNKNTQLAERLVDAGYYLSFGAALFKEDSNAAKAIIAIPHDRFFLETDDAPVEIDEMYTAAASLQKTGEDALILQVQNNFRRVFTI